MEFTATSPTLHSEIHTVQARRDGHFLSYIVRYALRVVVKKNDKFDSCYVRKVST